MESDFETNDMLTLSHDSFDDANDNDNLDVEGETCGICMDMVIDRGVLDCCQHWFCFVCIDNWATITNLCPLCQNEFQLITCVPVYDTIGSNKVEDGSFFRDDDWSIDGKNNSLSFPSYYIDENAVTCLDGDGCKIRNGFASVEEDSGLDTSIACDSCDLWYHAFCVGFDTEGTSESTWLCPRCVADAVSKETDGNSIKEASLECNPDSNNSECHAGIVSVSIADTGETAVVVSMVDRNKWIPETSERGLLPPEVDGDLLNEPCKLMSDTNNQLQAAEKTNVSPIMKGEELELSLSHPTSKSFVHSDLKESDNGTRCEPSSFDGTKLSDESNAKTSPCKIESDMGLHLGLSVGSFLTVDNVDKSESKDQATDPPCSIPEEFPLEGDKLDINACDDSARVTGRKRKHFDYSHEQVRIKVEDEDANPELSVEASQKKTRAAVSQMFRANDSDAQLSDNAKKSPVLKHSPTKEIAASDIMNIVKGTNRRLTKGLADTNASKKLAEKKENMTGLRVKKIMKRVSDDGESSSLVQNLRKEIREAVRNKSSINFEENHFDKNLLEAFRAAITGPKTELVNKLSPSALKAKKSMLQKGKVRENLTRKIFGTSNGRRKRAWDRDCEIEFWKYRCMRASKPEKVETLKSVLDLLRKSSEKPESERAPECQAKNPILSRLYIADTSVFPRKEDVKPFSEQTKQNNPSAKGPNQSVDNKIIKATEVNNLLSMTRVCLSEKKVDKIVRGPAGKVQLSSRSEGASVSSSAGAKVGTKDSGLKSDSVKGDKRKWALEVLARKTAVASKNTANESQEDDAIFKGNYPLLAQLPTDMRPVLAPCRHNKIPVSVRQTQLYRLTERLLKNTNLPIIRRTADTELAVADAINIEKEVADRSKSKLVYLNLCSQELLHRTNNTKSNINTDTTLPTSSSPVQTDQSVLNTDDLLTDPAVQIALKNAGLFSDSPPSSPRKNNEICNEKEVSGPDDILELESHPELDIYGDFEYDLEDDDYIGASVTKIPKLKEEPSESKVKLVFSTTSLKKTNNALDSADCKGSENNEVPGVAFCSPNCHRDAVQKDSTINAEIGQPSVSSGLLLCEGAVEPVDSEFEDLYGPDKEPLIKKFPDGELQSLHGEGKMETQSENNDCHKEEERDLEKAINGAELGNESVPIITGKPPNTSGTDENIQRKEERRKEERSDIPAQKSNNENQVAKKVEAYIKEHIRPLCKSGVITAEQYRWAVAKTTEKVMKHHCKSKNANFLVKEGEKVKKLAEQYVETAQQNRKS